MRRVLPGDRWEQVERLFQEAADLPPCEREELLDSRCGADPQLRDEVLSLLRYDTRREPPLLEAIHEDAASIAGDAVITGRMPAAEPDNQQGAADESIKDSLVVDERRVRGAAAAGG